MGVARSEFVPILVEFLQQRKSAPKQGVSQLEAAELLKQRFQEREADAQNTFEDFALNGEIRIGDLPDLIPEFATVLGLELAGANPDSCRSNECPDRDGWHRVDRRRSGGPSRRVQRPARAYEPLRRYCLSRRGRRVRACS